ncbi:MAG: caspase family protein [Acidobacteriaceae bacterium]|nr:caspase family protein [Acidobacteriaceae bacterium]
MKKVCLLLACAGLVHATTFYVTVAGLGGEPEYEQRFSGWAKDIDKAVRAGNDVKVETLYGSAATRDKLRSVLGDIARDAKPGDALVLMLIGHGTYDGTEYKFNLPGPDVSASELATLLDRIPARQLVVNMTSASGGSRAVLEKQNRAVITATKTGTEKNATVFARYWVEALRDPAADTDKNEVISALEAFRYAEQKTAKFYETQKRLATEHPILEDTGKGEGTKNPSPENGQGLLASRIPVMRLSNAQNSANTPEKRQLLARKEELEQQIDALKYQKAAIPVEQYKRQLSSLLVELAKTQAELDK